MYMYYPTLHRTCSDKACIARLNYVNGFPVDAVEYGIDTLAPKLLGSSPDFVVSGPNVGSEFVMGEDI